MKEELKNPRDMYFGNLLIFENGIGTISNIKYVVIKEKPHFWTKTKYIAYPGELNVLLERKITPKDNNKMFLINSIPLVEKVGYDKISAKQLCEIIIKNNDPVQLKKIYKTN